MRKPFPRNELLLFALFGLVGLFAASFGKDLFLFGGKGEAMIRVPVKVRTLHLPSPGGAQDEDLVVRSEPVAITEDRDGESLEIVLTFLNQRPYDASLVYAVLLQNDIGQTLSGPVVSEVQQLPSNETLIQTQVISGAGLPNGFYHTVIAAAMTATDGNDTGSYHDIYFEVSQNELIYLEPDDYYNNSRANLEEQKAEGGKETEK
ncbi:MAG: hypothetical protein RBU45_22245 [Myxococcota bacterium]|jgi:hypothetical protein|nr:hypothetical protein [Myxococcota bacterium]